MKTVAAPVSAVDPFSPEFLSDPYPFLTDLREAGPVVRLERYGIWGMARHAEVHAALSDWQTFCSSRGVGLADFQTEPPWRPPSLVLEADPPLHTRARGVLVKVLSPAALKALGATFATEADRLVGALVARGRFDAVTDLAEAYPLKVFPDAVGLPAEGRENLIPYGSMAFNAFGPRNRLVEAAMAGAGPVIDWIQSQCRRQALAPGGMGARIFELAAAAGMTEAEGGLLVRSFLTAGVDTTVNGLGAALECLARDPEQWRLLHEDPSLARAAFEEALRHQSPVQTFFRTTTRPVEIAAMPIGAGEKVLLFLAAANRDPRRWEEPDRFDITRRAGGHVGFGVGIHGCVGQMLARLEGELVLTALARRVEAIEIVGEPRRRPNNTLRALSSLPVAVRPAVG